MRDRSMQTPPWGALTWPSSEVPVPNGITGTRCSAQMRTISATSSVESAKATASGGWFGNQVSTLACCSRTVALTVSRSPSRWPIDAIARATASSPALLLACTTAATIPETSCPSLTAP